MEGERGRRLPGIGRCSLSFSPLSACCNKYESENDRIVHQKQAGRGGGNVKGP